MQVMDTLAEIHERHNTVKDLERKLLELQQVDHTISNFLIWSKKLCLSIIACGLNREFLSILKTWASKTMF